MTPRLTAAEARMLGRRQEQPSKAPGDLLAIFVSGRLINTKNARLHHMVEYRYKRRWRERVALALLDAGWRAVPWNNRLIPKAVAFLARTAQPMDSDGLQLALAPIRDALVECGVVSGDAERDGHTWTYAQVIDRAQRGIEIRIRLREVTP